MGPSKLSRKTGAVLLVSAGPRHVHREGLPQAAGSQSQGRKRPAGDSRSVLGQRACWHLLCRLPPQAIQHIEGTREKQLLEEEEQRRGAVIVTPARNSLDPSNSDTASDLEAEDDDSMEHSKAGMP